MFKQSTKELKSFLGQFVSVSRRPYKVKLRPDHAKRMEPGSQMGQVG